MLLTRTLYLFGKAIRGTVKIKLCISNASILGRFVLFFLYVFTKSFKLF